MKRTLLSGLFLCVTFTITATGQKSESAEAMLGAAIHQEEAEGNLEAAIASYKKFLSQHGNNRRLAAKAQYRLGVSYEKLGNAEARTAFERVVRDYADQPDAAEARRRLAAMDRSPVATALVARRIPTSGEIDVSMSLSSDGRFMAMTDWSTGDIVIRDVSTGQNKRLLAQKGTWEGGANAESPILSPDLKQVAYVWYDGTVYDKQDLRVMPNQPGGKPHIVLSNPEYAYVSPAGWSPDSKSIMAVLWKTDGTGQIGWVSAANGAVKVLKSLEWRGPGETRLSPDGRYIAYSARRQSNSQGINIYILAADGSSETELIATGGINKDPVWTPDGNHLLFTSDRSGTFGLWSVPVQSGRAAGAPALVKSDLGRIVSIGWTGSGSLYYLHGMSDENVYAMDVDAAGNVHGARSRLTENFVGYNRVPSWSPDGKSIAFKRLNPFGNPWATIGYDLVIRSLETGEERTNTNGVFRNGMGAAQRPQWFPDGQSVLVDMLTNRGTAFYRVDIKTGEYKEVVPPQPSLNTRAALSPDGKTLYGIINENAENRARIVAFDLSTGDPRGSFTVEGRVPSLAVSPDGRFLAVRQRLVRRQDKNIGILARVRVDGSDYRELQTMTNDVGVEELAWTKDGRAILFGTELMRISADGGTPEPTGLKLERRHNIHLSADGSRLAFSDGNTSIVEMWALDNVLPNLKARK